MRKLLMVVIMATLMLTMGCAKTESPQAKYQKKAAAKIEAMQKKISEMKVKFKSRMADMQKSFEANIAKLQKQEEAAKKELAALKSASGQVWEKAKEKLDKTAAELEKSIEKMTSHLK